MKVVFVLAAACVALYAEVIEIPIVSAKSKHGQLVLAGGAGRTFIRKRSTGSQPLSLGYYDYYLGVISLGTPKQNFTVAMDTSTATLWVVNKNCTSRNCESSSDYNYTRSRYDSTKSSTYNDTGKQFPVLYNSDICANIASDTLNFGGLEVKNQLFGVAYIVSDHIGQMPYDGVFGLGWPEIAVSNLVPPIQNVLSQLSQPIFTIWLDRANRSSKTGNSGLITYGAIDTKNCDANVNYVALSATTYWQFPMTAFSIGSYRNRKTVQVISDSSGSWIGAPEDDFKAIVNQTGATYDDLREFYVVNCNATVSDLVFTIGRHKYIVPASEYVLDYDIGGGKCALAVYSFDYGGFGPQWDLGTAFLRSYCQIYDVGKKQIGFAKAAHN